MFRKLNKKRFKILVIFILALIVSACIIGGRKVYVSRLCAKAYDINTLKKSVLDEIVDDDVKNLMIVAHPDDEVLWGGGHLMTQDYLVVCMTNGKNKQRAEEFSKVMEESGNKYLMLDYPDKVAGRRDNWESVKEQMISDLELLINYKDWDIIVTHNQNGEYGHIQHQEVHSFVTEIYDRSPSNSKMYCFGQYYKLNKIFYVSYKLEPISEEEYLYKKKLADIYTSQGSTINNLWHMANYEMWTEYEKYSEHPQLKYAGYEQDAERSGDLVNEV